MSNTYLRIKEKNRKDGKPFIGSDGRKKVVLYKNGKGKEFDLAWLVATSFQDICGEPKEGLPMFKDGNSNNCAAYNLYWE